METGARGREGTGALPYQMAVASARPTRNQTVTPKERP